MESNPSRVSASLYVGDIPKDLESPEDTLYPIFGKVGMVISVKVCRDVNTQMSLGYAYVNYQNPADAERALQTLNYSEIRPGKEIRVMWSVRDPSIRKRATTNLFVKNLPPKLSNRQLYELGSQYGHVTSVKHALDKDGGSAGYGFICYETDEEAERALEELKDKQLDAEHTLQAARFIGRGERAKEVAKTFTAVYAKNIKSDVTEEAVVDTFKKYGKVASSFLSGHPKFATKYAIINFETHEEAVAAIEGLHESTTTELVDKDTKLYVTRLRHKSERPPSTSPFQNEGRNIYVKNLPDEITEERLKDIFGIFGPIESISLQRDDRGMFRGFAFICYETKEAAGAAVSNHHHKYFINNRPLYVQLAQRKDSRIRFLDAQRRSMMQQQQQQQQMMFQWPYRPYGPPGMPPNMGFAPMIPVNMNSRRNQAPRQQRQQGGANQGGGGGGRGQQMNRGVYPQAGPRPPQGDFAAQLAIMGPEERKNVLGERLYSLIQPINPPLAAKITGMLLEMETNEILNVLEDQSMLHSKVHEAISVLQAHENSTH